MSRVKKIRSKRNVALAVAVITAAATAHTFAQSTDAPVGQGFNVNRDDLRFILTQIRIAEEHARTRSTANPCNTQLGAADGSDGPFRIPNNGAGRDLPWGLRTVDGSCNNLVTGRSEFGAADNVFPRLVPRNFRAGETGDPDGSGPAPSGPTSYAQKSGTVIDSRPRTISNLIVDQSDDNPAAVAVRADAGAAEGDVEIPNVAPDTGLSAPFNSVFTFFGQFFDHGLDLVGKSNDLVFMPLKEDDPLFDTTPPAQRFMVLNRATNQPGPDGVLGTADDVQEHTNTTSAFVDQNQTYTSHPSHQVFLREYNLRPFAGPNLPRAVETGRLITGPGDGMATWDNVQAQALTRLGIRLSDFDALNVPLLATDPYGNYLPGPLGFPQIVTTNGMVEGIPGVGVPVPANAIRTGHAFLDDIAHAANPRGDRNPNNGPGPIENRDPDTDTVAGTDDNNFATYDDELLGAHFIAGDGRVNENVGLTSIHHVFHSEHNRLVGHIQTVLLAEENDPAILAQWRNDLGQWDGDRLFQAAKFVTEMEYQHLVFEEFIRKVQPLTNAFGEGGTGFNADVDPSIRAEFAHAVYRFGHSMLNETVARRGPQNDIPLLNAFLNPREFLRAANGSTLSPDAAAGAFFRGSVDQRGNEIDEFVTGALRNQLLGLPLDLATLNIARGRDVGLPTLNEARRAFYRASGNSWLIPYENWVDFGRGLKYRQSMTNFIAAYGLHPSVVSATTIDAKRAAARSLLGLNEAGDPATPNDAEAFLNSTGATWGDLNGRSRTGVDDIDLWVGGLAERGAVFGGFLGSTFNYVFEKQAEDLQDGDRFYYLSRTAGLNLLVQLEGNSLSELIMRNTDVEGLPADAFSRADLNIDAASVANGQPLGNLNLPDGEGDNLRRMKDGTIRYTGAGHTVWNGSDTLGDRIWSGEGDDTIRGNGGNDWIQGGDGNDNLIGGLGDDILLDLAGDETIKGGDGNDVISSGQGFGGDLNQGGRGKDFIVGGNDITESFGGPGDDFIFGGDDLDTVFGDDGNDWIEGGRGPFNLLQGDNGAPFQNDLNEGGHDVLIGYGGEQDYDAEGGDDIMYLGTGIQRAEGMAGFDWAIHKQDPLPGDSDMLVLEGLPAAIDTNRDRFDRVEALSGWNLDDVLLGDDLGNATLEPGEVPGVEDEPTVLTVEGMNRIAGLRQMLGLSGNQTFSGGNILIGGAGSDLMEGRGGNDFIDGDRWLDTRLRYRTNAAPNVNQFADTMGEIQDAVLAGLINPGNIFIDRRIVLGSGGVDTARFSDVEANYDVSEPDANGIVTVTHARGTQADGTDRLRGIETLQFSDGVQSTVPNAPTLVTATAGNEQATVEWTAPTNDGGGEITRYEIDVRVGNTVVRTVGTPPQPEIGPADTSEIVTGLTNGTEYTFTVRAVNAIGSGPASTPSNPVVPTGPAGPPAPLSAPLNVTATAGALNSRQAIVDWDAPASSGTTAIVSYTIYALRPDNSIAAQIVSNGAGTGPFTMTLPAAGNYRFAVAATNGAGLGPRSAPSNEVTVTAAANPPSAPIIRVPGTGQLAGSVDALARWSAPADNGGAPITAYRIFAFVGGTQIASVDVAGNVDQHRMILPDSARFRLVSFEVVAINAGGESPRSARSVSVFAQ